MTAGTVTVFEASTTFVTLVVAVVSLTKVIGLSEDTGDDSRVVVTGTFSDTVSGVGVFLDSSTLRCDFTGVGFLLSGFSISFNIDEIDKYDLIGVRFFSSTGFIFVAETLDLDFITSFFSCAFLTLPAPFRVEPLVAEFVLDLATASSISVKGVLLVSNSSSSAFIGFISSDGLASFTDDFSIFADAAVSDGIGSTTFPSGLS